MGDIFHFGDSYSCTGENKEKHFVELLSEDMGYNYNGIGRIPGGSNEQILTKLLSIVYEIKKKDMLFFNFSFFTRGCFYDSSINDIRSTNSYYNEDNKNISVHADEKIMEILTYQLNCVEDYNRRLFTQFDIIFRLLIKNNVFVNYIFIDNYDWSNKLLCHGNNITFNNGFQNWLHEKSFHNNEECHYTRNVQPLIYNEIKDMIDRPEY